MFPWHSKVAYSEVTIRRMARINLIYPVPTEEPAIAGRGCMVTATYVIPLESINVNMGGPSADANGSGSTDGATRPKSPDAAGGSQRGHTTRRTGKPSTWGKATP